MAVINPPEKKLANRTSVQCQEENLSRWFRFLTFWTNYILNLPKRIFMHEKKILATIFGMHVALCASVLL